jgi:hypothetical protein
VTRLEMANLTSGVGAVVLGLGLGALGSQWLVRVAGLLAVIGLVMHGFGMWDKHRLESHNAAGSSRWALAMYWGCWVLLVVVVGFLALRLV